MNFTKGKILGPLISFTLPVLGALILQAMYGAIDLLIVGRFGTAADVSAVSTGAQIMQTVTSIITGLAMGTTVLLGQRIGREDYEAAGEAVGGGICLFAIVAVALTGIMQLIAEPFARLMNAPAEAFAGTVSYVRWCSAGAVFIVAYNLLGSVFRGIGDSKTPLITVAIASGANVILDILFVAGFKMAAGGAAIATVIAQALSVIISLAIIRKRKLSFTVRRDQLRLSARVSRDTVKLGAPVAFQDLMVSISFLVILAIVNSFGVIASAGIGVAEKLCGFVMLVPGSFMQSMSAFVAQNIGAGEPVRARRAMLYGMLSSLSIGVIMAYVSFFHGDALASIFSKDADVIAAAASYLKAYSIDTLLVSFLFCFAGYFNGCGKTAFVMAQGIVGAFMVRIPVSYMMSRIPGASLFMIGLATPCSTVVQIAMCGIYCAVCRRRERANELRA